VDDENEESPRRGSEIAIRVGTVIVEVPPGFDDDTLLRVLALVRQATC